MPFRFSIKSPYATDKEADGQTDGQDPQRDCWNGQTANRANTSIQLKTRNTLVLEK